ncbi:MAG: prolipoprotein diacylglyceryl transferase [Bacteroidales bacterium]|nr:prolipoprotein diacylglyceryl transferase [Bacteroidales bacterium]
MRTLFIIDTTNGALYYAIFNLASIILATGMVFYSGIKKGYPLISWLLIILTGGFFFLVGEKLATYSPGEWRSLFTGLDLPPTSRKTILGGIIGIIAGVLMAKKWFRFQGPVLDHYALALPVFIAVSRSGCLMTGCCFGTTTNLPWAIQYDYKSAAFETHLLQSQVRFEDNLSAAIHPVQIYEMIGCLMIAFLVWKTRKKFSAGENLFLFSMLCYASLRFITEFVRAPESDLVLGKLFFGLKGIQWILLLVTLAGVIILVLRELQHRPSLTAKQLFPVTLFRQAMLLLFISSLALSGRNWFTNREFTLILVFLIPVSIFMLGKISLSLIKSK